jgi:hypothetical protein
LLFDGLIITRKRIRARHKKGAKGKGTEEASEEKGTLPE